MSLKELKSYLKDIVQEYEEYACKDLDEEGKLKDVADQAWFNGEITGRSYIADLVLKVLEKENL